MDLMHESVEFQWHDRCVRERLDRVLQEIVQKELTLFEEDSPLPHRSDDIAQVQNKKGWDVNHSR
jgi:hypothetical protein